MFCTHFYNLLLKFDYWKWIKSLKLIKILLNLDIFTVSSHSHDVFLLKQSRHCVIRWAVIIRFSLLSNELINWLIDPHLQWTGIKCFRSDLIFSVNRNTRPSALSLSLCLSFSRPPPTPPLMQTSQWHHRYRRGLWLAAGRSSCSCWQPLPRWLSLCLKGVFSVWELPLLLLLHAGEQTHAFILYLPPSLLLLPALVLSLQRSPFHLFIVLVLQAEAVCLNGGSVDSSLRGRCDIWRQRLMDGWRENRSMMLPLPSPRCVCWASDFHTGETQRERGSLWFISYVACPPSLSPVVSEVFL